MDCLARLAAASAVAEKLISEKTKDPNYRPIPFARLGFEGTEIAPMPEFGQAVVQHILGGGELPEAMLCHDGKVSGSGADRPFPSFETAKVSHHRPDLRWGVEAAGTSEHAGEEARNSAARHEVGSKTIEFGATSRKASGPAKGEAGARDRTENAEAEEGARAEVKSQTVEGRYCRKSQFGNATFNHSRYSGRLVETRTVGDGRGTEMAPDAVVVFKAEAQKKLCALDAIVQASRKAADAKKQKNNTLVGAFKKLIHTGAPAKPPAERKSPEMSARQPAASTKPDSGAGKSALGKAIDSAAALETVVRSDGFRRYMDRQIVSTISRVDGFQRHYNKILGPKDVRDVVDGHRVAALRCIAELVESHSGIESCDEYKVLEAHIRQKDTGRADGEGRRPGYQTDECVQLARYQNMLEVIVESINKGNLECDCRFLKLINRTICKLGAYDDPVVSKMTVQFVVCKRYVEDYVRIKRAVKNFTGCDL